MSEYVRLACRGCCGRVRVSEPHLLARYRSGPGMTSDVVYHAACENHPSLKRTRAEVVRRVMSEPL